MTRWLWLFVGVLAAAIIAWRFEPVVDLAWFLPAPKTASEQVLLERLGQGPGSQLIFVSFQADEDTDVLLLSDELRQSLEQSGFFQRVANGQFDPSVAAIPAVIWQQRYLLSDLRLDDEALQAMLAERLADMASIPDPWFGQLLAADPPLAALQLLERIAPVSGGDFNWVDPESHTVVLVAESIAPAFELAAQEQLVTYLRNLQVEGVTQISVHGMGVYGVDLQATIRAEATFRSALASGAVLLILLLAYRRPIALVAGALPLVLAALVSLAVITVLFGKIHGITLAFGFTLLGVAIDYPLHFLSHQRGDANVDSTELNSIWKTMRVGVISTLAAYLAIAAGGSVGLAQMGLFSAVGIGIAYLATRTLLPNLLAPSRQPAAQQAAAVASPAKRTADVVMQRPDLDHRVWLVVVAASAVLLLTVARPQWTDDLSAVSPVPAERLMQDAQLRRDFGAPDISSLLVLRDASQEQVLLQTESLAALLDSYIATSELGSYQAVTTLVPSVTRQQQRQANITAAERLAERLDEAAVAAGFRAGVFNEFITQLGNSSVAQTITPADYADSEFDGLVNAGLYAQAGEWVSVITLQGVAQAGLFAERINQDAPAAIYVNLKQVSVGMMQRYRYQVMQTLLLAAVLIIAYLGWSIGLRKQGIWVLGTLVAAQCVTLAVSTMVLGSLSIFNLIAAVLVAGLGLDYALFSAREEHDGRARANTRHALAICAGSTAAAFAILAVSSIPVLQSIGVTAAIGVAASYLLALAGSRVRSGLA